MVVATEGFMDAIGWEMLPTVETGLRNRDPCGGVVLFALYALFLIAFPGPWRHKVWFIPAGIAVLHAVNVARVIALLFVQYATPDWLQFNHDYTFTVLIYTIIFGLWYAWIRWFVLPKSPSTP